MYQDALTKGMPKVVRRRGTMTAAVAKGAVPSPSESRRTAERLRKEAAASRSSAMVKAAAPEKKSAAPASVKKAARRKLAQKKQS